MYQLVFQFVVVVLFQYKITVCWQTGHRSVVCLFFIMIHNDPKILNWNVRGLNTVARREAVKIVCQQVRPFIICLQETKLSTVAVPLPMEFMGAKFSNFEYIPADETRGGVLIAWDGDFIIRNLVRKDNFCLSVEVKLRWTNQAYILTGVYGPANDRDKQSFLTELTGCQPVGRPWICLGDFNLICDAQDKNNDNINRANMR